MRLFATYMHRELTEGVAYPDALNPYDNAVSRRPSNVKDRGCLMGSLGSCPSTIELRPQSATISIS